MSTIFALASGAGRAGVSVFRVSGPDTKQIIKTLTGRKAPKPRFAALRTFKHQDGTPIDEGLLLYFKGPASFTGEDVAEFHTHGSPAVTELMAEAFLAAGAKQAGPGEFTRRAFDNGRMDLTEAEGLADLIDAETKGQHTQALRQMQGALRQTYEGWREHILDALASIEGEIDFPDEADVPDVLAHRAYAPLEAARTDMTRLLSEASRGERIRDGLTLAIIGAPNAGKSTLLNALAGREAAIVSNIPGTTRDIVDVHLTLAGLPVQIADTAGLRDTGDTIEAEGVKRAEQRANESDIRIAVIDGSAPNPDMTSLSLLKDGDIVLINKTDQGSNPLPMDINYTVMPISAKTGQGLDPFYGALESVIKSRFSVTRDAGLTRARHRNCTQRALDALTRAQSQLVMAPELAGDDCRTALHAIKELAGETDIDAVLDRIFSRFCIGK